MTTEKKQRKKQTLRRESKQKKTALRASSKTKLRDVKKSSKSTKSDLSRPKKKPESVAPASALISERRGATKALASKTMYAPRVNNDRKWLLIDASEQTVGRLASEVAMLLRGKHKAGFTPQSDAGDFVVIVNAEKVKFTRDKEQTKKYYDHSGWIGGMKVRTAARVRKEHPERLLERAVHGMIKRSPLGRDMMKKLKIYSGSEHPHAAQRPEVWALKYQTSKKA